MSESAREAGYSSALQNQAGKWIEPKAQENIKQALISKGVSNERIAAVLERGLTATKHVKDVGEVDDFKERRETARLALECLGELKTGNTVAVQINFPAGLAELLAKDAEEYKGDK